MRVRAPFRRKELTVAKKAKKKASRKRTGSGAAPVVKCGVVPERGPFTFPAGGGEFFVLVSYPTGPDACPYTATPRVRWMTTNPRISEFDVVLQPNPRRKAREGVVVVQGQGNPTRHRVTIRQSGR
jgi:hypothetical protein